MRAHHSDFGYAKAMVQLGVIRGVLAGALVLGSMVTLAGQSSAASEANITVPITLATTEGEALPGQPHIIPREVWGARDPKCNWAGQDGAVINHAVIHHTYEPTGEPSIESAYAALQHIQNLHMDDNDWCDIGYSFLVDWFGNVYEGSKGTIERPITSAHTSGLNFQGIGIAIIGDHSTEPPTDAAIKAAGEVAGWALGFYGLAADNDIQLTVGGANNMWAQGTRITVPVIVAHRDVVRTECPGDAGYARLPEVIDYAQQVSAAMQTAGQFGMGQNGVTPIFATSTEPVGPHAPEGEAPAPGDPGGTETEDDNPATAGESDDMAETPTPAEEFTLDLWWVAALTALVGFAAWYWVRRKA